MEEIVKTQNTNETTRVRADRCHGHFPNIVQSFYGKKSVNLPLIATEGFSTVLDSAMYPY